MTATALAAGSRGGPAWVLHGMTGPRQSTIEHVELGMDQALFDFLQARLREDLERARAAAGRAPAQTVDVAAVADPAVTVLEQALLELNRGQLPDDVSLQLLLWAFCDHVDFRPSWMEPTVRQVGACRPCHGPQHGAPAGPVTPGP